MSVLQYNGITFPFVYVDRFIMDAVYDESGTDRIYTKISISCSAVINTAYLPIVGGLGTQLQNKSADLPNTIVSLRNYMLEPRRSLSLTFNGTELMPSRIVAGTVDAKNGPQPRSCQLMELNNNTWFMQWTCEGNYWEKLEFVGNSANTENQAGNNVVSNRWSERQEIDNKNYSKIIRTGTYIIRSDNSGGIIADEARVQMAVVSVPSGYLREGSSYEVTPDGLSIRYQVIDREVWKMPPFPAFTAKGAYIEDVANGTGGVRMGECRITLEGGRDTDQMEMVKIAIATCSAKLSMRQAKLIGGGGKDKFFLTTGKVEIGLFDNYVDCVLRGRYEVDQKRINGIAAFNTMSASTPFSFPNYTPGYKSRGNKIGGNKGILLQAAAYYDPSLQATQLSNTGQLTTGVQVGAGATVQQSSSATPTF